MSTIVVGDKPTPKPGIHTSVVGDKPTPKPRVSKDVAIDKLTVRLSVRVPFAGSNPILRQNASKKGAVTLSNVQQNEVPRCRSRRPPNSTFSPYGMGAAPTATLVVPRPSIMLSPSFTVDWMSPATWCLLVSLATAVSTPLLWRAGIGVNLSSVKTGYPKSIITSAGSRSLRSVNILWSS